MSDSDAATGVWDEPADQAIRRLEAENERLRAELADEMRECEKGHVRLMSASDDWIDHGCHWCEIDRLEAIVERLRELLRDVVDGNWTITGIQEVLGDFRVAAKEGGQDES